MGIEYRFNEWRASGEQVKEWSPMAYKLVSKNVQSNNADGFKIGQVLYLHHVKGMTASEIRKSSAGYGLTTSL